MLREATCHRIRKISVAASVLCLAGCAVVQLPLPDFDSGQIENVGVYVSPIGDPTHTHIGTTVFNNFAVPYPQDWALADDFAAAIESALEAKGFNAVDLGGAGVTQAELKGSINRSGRRRQEAEPEVLAKLDGAGIAAVVTVHPMEYLLATMNCSAYGCAEHFAQGYGIFSRGVLGNINYFTAFAFDVTAMLVNPPAEITQSAPLEQLRYYKNKSRLWQHSPPADLRNVKGASWERLHEDMVAQMSEFAVAIASVLAGDAME